MRLHLRSAFLAFVVCAGIVPGASSTIIHVPGDAPTIQAGIDMAAPSDTVEVACGTYQGGVILKDSIVLRSQTGLANCVTIQTGGNITGLLCQDLPLGVVIEGFRFDGMGGYGGAIRSSHSTVTARNCVVEHFYDIFGGGINAVYSTVHVENCVFVNNTQDEDSVEGSALSCFASTVSIANSTFEENTHSTQGGALGAHTSTVDVVGCTFRKNRGESQYQSVVTGAAIWARLSTLSVHSTTFEDNFCHSSGSAIYMDEGYLEVDGCSFEGNKSLEVYGRGCLSFESGLIKNCTFRRNFGGAVIARELMARDCVFDENKSYWAGIDLVSYGQSCLVERCTFVRSACWIPVEAILISGSSAVLRQSIIAFGDQSRAIGCTGNGTIAMECCDIYGNDGGDWIGCIGGQEDVNGNISADPLFCDLSGGDYTLHENSPCAPPQSGDCGQIGAFGVGCGSVHVEPSSWGSIKALYR